MGEHDGHLELDVHGDVVGEPDTSGEESLDILDEWGGPSWAERLDAVGVTPWLRTHRLPVLFATTVSLAVVLGGGSWWTHRPPAVDPTMAVEVVVPPVLDDPAITDPAGDALVATYGLRSTGWDQSTYRITGLSGPLLRAVDVHRPLVEDSPGLGLVDYAVVAAVPECDDPQVLSTTRATYALDVRKTDAWGRVVDDRIELVPMSYPDWQADIAAFCMPRIALDALDVRSMTLTEDVAAHAVRADVLVRNRLPIETVGQAGPGVGETTRVTTTMIATELPPGSDVVLPLRYVVNDCTTPPRPTAVEMDDVWTAGPSQIPAGTRGTAVRLEVVPNALPLGVLEVVVGHALVRLPTRLRVELERALARVCGGAPTLEVSDPVAGRSVVDRAAVDPVVTVPLTIVVRTDALSVRLEDAAPPQYGDYLGVAAAAAVVSDGRAILRTTWSFTCEEGAEPPLVSLSVRAAQRTYPYLVRWPTVALEQRLVRACGSSVGVLTSSGWPVSGATAFLR